MGRWEKTDNHDPSKKLAVRRYFLNKYHRQPPRVFDACQGSGLLWADLRREFGIQSYWGVDIKPKKGRIKIDSLKVLDQPGWLFDVVDVDAYGSPWKHFWAIHRHMPEGEMTVFLTVGNAGFSSQDEQALAAIGLSFKVPIGLHKSMSNYVSETCVKTRNSSNIDMLEIVEAPNPGGTARYFGVRLQRKGR